MSCGPSCSENMKVSPCLKRAMFQGLRDKVLGKHLLSSDYLRALADVSSSQPVRNIENFAEKLQRPVLIDVLCHTVCQMVQTLKNFSHPTVLLGLGRDDRGSPILGCDRGNKPQNVQCFKELLELESVSLYIVSQHRSNFTHKKMKLVPIGFGEKACHLQIGVPEDHLRQIYEAAYRHFDKECEHFEGGHENPFFMNHISGKVRSTDNYVQAERKRIRSDSANAMLSLGAINSYKKFTKEEMIVQACMSLIGASPRGTGADCHRHVELLLAGQIVIANMDEAAYEPAMYQSLPIVFIHDWKAVDCVFMENLVKQYLHNGNQSYEYERLTSEYWRHFIVQELCSLSTSTPQCSATFKTMKGSKLCSAYHSLVLGIYGSVYLRLSFLSIVVRTRLFNCFLTSVSIVSIKILKGE